MSNTRNTGFLTNVVKYTDKGDISFVSGSTTLMSISSSGAVTVTGVISGSNALTSSYSQNSELLDNLDSTSFVFTSSFNTYSSSMSTRVTNTESTGSTLTSASASLNTASGSFSTRVTKIEGNYATTGSNVFLGAQTVCANITSTGTIIAQTLNVQQVTSSVVYSSGSNVFGNLSTDVQQMTGSVRITGSLNVIGTGCFSGQVCANSIGLPSGGTINNLANIQYGGYTWASYAASDGTITLSNVSGCAIKFATGPGCFAGTVCAPGHVSSEDVRIYRSAGTTTGYINFGSTGTNYFGFDGSKYVANGAISATNGLFNGCVCAPYVYVGQNTTGDTSDYTLQINRHGSLLCSHAYTTCPAFQINELSNSGPTSGVVDTNGIWNLSFGRYSHTMSCAKFATLMHIGYDGAMGPLRVDGRGNIFIGYDRTAKNPSDATFSLLVACGIAAGSYQYCVPPNGGALFSGKVSIGDAAPVSALVVSTTSDTTSLGQSGIVIQGSTTLTAGCVMALSFTAIPGTTRARAAIGSVVGSDWGKGNLAFYTRDASDSTSLGTADERMRITSGGDIRIGPSTTSSQWYFNYNNTNNKGGISINYSTGEYQIWAGESGNGYYQTFYTNGAERMRITSVGNIGIGTCTPCGSASERTIHLAGNSSTNATIYVTRDTYARTILGTNSNGGIVGTQSDNSFYIVTNDVARLCINNAGVACFSCTVNIPSLLLIGNGCTDKFVHTNMMSNAISGPDNTRLLANQQAIGGCQLTGCTNGSYVHIKTNITKTDVMVGLNVRGYGYAPFPIDTDIAFYTYSPVSYVYGVCIHNKASTAWSYCLYYSSDSKVVLVVQGLGTYDGFYLNGINPARYNTWSEICILGVAKVSCWCAQF